MAKKVFQERLNESLEKFRDHTAIEYGNRHISYGELDKRANYIANWIVNRGFPKEAFIGVLMDDRVEFTVVMIGIFNAGCVFVPLDPAHPQDRLEEMIESTGVRLVISDKAALRLFDIHSYRGDAGKKTDMEFILIDNLFSTGEPSWFTRKPDVRYDPEDKIYIYFTSGTTGKPSAVIGKNKSLAHYLQWEIDTFNIARGDRLSQFSTVGFDAFLKEAFAALFPGGTLCIPRHLEVILNGEQLLGWLQQYKISIFHCVPSIFRLLNSCQLKGSHLPGLKYILLSGESIYPADFKKWFNVFDERIRIVNLYGLTETTILKTYYIVKKDDLNRNRIPIGQPIKGTRIIILDEKMNICNKDMTGEIYIRTPYRSCGYYNNPRLNEKMFIRNPFSDDPNDIICKTGDLGRFLADGNIEFLGRLDRQVKLRGMRVELEEIEHVLNRHPLVGEAVVVKQEMSKGHDILCAFIRVEEDQDKPLQEQELVSGLKKYALDKLPAYMVPDRLIKLEKIPRKPNGKINFEALEVRFRQLEEKMEHDIPENTLELKLINIWSKILNTENIGGNSNFFELGGNSLNVIALISEIHREFNIRPAISQIFNKPTLKQQSRVLEMAKEETYRLIEPVEKKEYYGLSSAQKRVYIMHQMDKESVGYNIPRTYVLEGKVEKEKLEDLFRTLIKRHESFRTSFEMLDGEPVQRIHDEVEFVLEYFQLGQEEVREELEHFIRPFDLSRAPLLRVGLIKTVESKHLLMIDMYHIITDGASDSVLGKDIMALYNGEDLPELTIQYKDFSEWQNRMKESESMKKQEEYWWNEFNSEIPDLNLPADFQRPALHSFEGNKAYFTLSAEEVDAVKRFALETGSTLFIIFLTVFNVFLHKVSGQEDIVVGIPSEGRRQGELRQIIGMFVNTLALRNYPGRDRAFTDFLGEVKKRTIKAYDNQDYQFEDLVEKVDLKRDASRNPIFDVKFQLEKSPDKEFDVPHLKLGYYDFEDRTSKFDLSLDGIEVEGKVFFCFNYCTRLFKEETVEVFIDYFRNIVSSLREDPHKKLREIDIASGERRETVLKELNRDLEEEAATILGGINVFQEKLRDRFVKFKDHAAIEYDGCVVTYGELDKRSDPVARFITSRGIKPQTFLGILSDNRIEIITAAIGIIKTNCVIAPLYSAYPDTRIEAMIDTTDLEYLFVDAVNFNRFNNKKPPLTGEKQFIFTGDLIWGNKPDLDKESGGYPVAGSPDDMLYIHFTSGTTGEPKAIIGKNKSLLHFINWEIDTFNIDSEIRTAQFTIPGFDPFLRDVFAPLFAGGTVCVPGDKDVVIKPEELVSWINGFHIGLIHCVASLFRLLNTVPLTPDHFRALRCILLAGEKINPSDLVNWYDIFSERIGLFNLYGPTETTMSKVYYPICPGDIHRERIPIGKPIKGARAVILDEDLHLCDVLVKGEICIRTPYRGVGYYSAPGLNQEKFIRNPFSADRDDIIYRSGDLGRLLPDGNIDILGRIDRQVKIRGYRVELEEIESVLTAHPSIEEAVVVKKENPGNNEILCAYIVGDKVEGDEIFISDLRRYLSEKLPDYMVPVHIKGMEGIPRRATGKVDYDALPDPLKDAEKVYTPPRSDIERRLLKLWSEILGIETIGIDERFMELGGNSLNVMTLISKIYKEFDVRISLGEIFNKSTIKKQAEHIMAARKVEYAVPEPVERKEYYVTASPQKRLYVLQQMEQGSTAYNMIYVFPLAGGIDIERLEKAIKKIVQRHESFRTSFAMIAGEPIQRVHREVSFEIEHYKTDGWPQGTEAVFNRFVRPFDLSQAPMLRIGLVNTEEGRLVLLMDVHHIIADWVSLEILERDLTRLYNGETPPPLKFQYKDYAEWQASPGRTTAIRKQEEFWIAQFEGGVPQLNLPTDYPRHQIQSFEGDRLYFHLKEAETRALKKIALEEKATMFMVLLAIYNVLLFKITGQEDIVVGSDIAGRKQEDLQDIIGNFVNTLALRNSPAEEKTFREFLQEVKTCALDTFDNQDYPFEDLVDRLLANRNPGRNPIFDVMFYLIEIDKISGEVPEEKVDHQEERQDAYKNKTAKFDLNLSAVEDRSGIYFTLEYCTKLFKTETVRKFVSYFKEILEAVVESPDIKLRDISITHDLLYARAEIEQVRFGF